MGDYTDFEHYRELSSAIENLSLLSDDVPCFDMRTEQGRIDLENLNSPTDFIFIIPEVRYEYCYDL